MESLVANITGHRSDSNIFKKVYTNAQSFLKKQKVLNTDEGQVSERVLNIIEKFALFNQLEKKRNLEYLIEFFIEKDVKDLKRAEYWKIQMIHFLLELSNSPTNCSYLGDIRFLKSKNICPVKTWNEILEDDPLTGDHWQMIEDDGEISDFEDAEYFVLPRKNDPDVTAETEDISKALTSPSNVDWDKETQDFIPNNKYWKFSMVDLYAPNLCYDFKSSMNLCSNVVSLSIKGKSELIGIATSRILLSEYEIVREVLFMLSGLPCAIFPKEDNQYKVCPEVVLSHLSPKGLMSICEGFVEIANEIYNLKAIALEHTIEQFQVKISNKEISLINLKGSDVQISLLDVYYFIQNDFDNILDFKKIIVLSDRDAIAYLETELELYSLSHRSIKNSIHWTLYERLIINFMVNLSDWIQFGEGSLAFLNCEEIESLHWRELNKVENSHYFQWLDKHWIRILKLGKTSNLLRKLGSVFEISKFANLEISDDLPLLDSLDNSLNNYLEYTEKELTATLCNIMTDSEKYNLHSELLYFFNFALLSDEQGLMNEIYRQIFEKAEVSNNPLYVFNATLIDFGISNVGITSNKQSFETLNDFIKNVSFKYKVKFPIDQILNKTIIEKANISKYLRQKSIQDKKLTTAAFKLLIVCSNLYSYVVNNVITPQILSIKDLKKFVENIFDKIADQCLLNMTPVFITMSRVLDYSSNLDFENFGTIFSDLNFLNNTISELQKVVKNSSIKYLMNCFNV
ncbi:hypothetical protein O9G_003348 [Rozella allomycis CSF55]|uniref:Spindle pole body component n=1 Tax=Rozella allomycis (strain CSF55) TaxID=988480 RepID=A0A075B032_ROZAC|nr:hypothetical protein O9G_003348 [Rozella allomycis CSF55]|eukprot:EPZ35730.1 hypothetical protein O9G_003348 [Rozella allomycis CSF55]